MPGRRLIIQGEAAGVFVGIDDYGPKPHIAILERGFAQIHGNDLILVCTRTGEGSFVRVQLVGHSRTWSDG